MGGPSIGFCAGRQDDVSGYDSLELGPTPEQVGTAGRLNAKHKKNTFTVKRSCCLSWS